MGLSEGLSVAWCILQDTVYKTTKTQHLPILLDRIYLLRDISSSLPKPGTNNVKIQFHDVEKVNRSFEIKSLLTFMINKYCK